MVLILELFEWWCSLLCYIFLNTLPRVKDFFMLITPTRLCVKYYIRLVVKARLFNFMMSFTLHVTERLNFLLCKVSVITLGEDGCIRTLLNIEDKQEIYVEEVYE